MNSSGSLYFCISSRSRDLKAISAGERPFDSSHASKSRIRTVCFTSGCFDHDRNGRLAVPDEDCPTAPPATVRSWTCRWP